ncbi:sphingomyelinase family [Cladophialophora carrionii]|uniref:Sphingomyelinase family n=1 Tax=Cladophialophora carrionii TaxID=86049 RepID=A0A1C1CDA5_9EURO|nr:sphingomyelinase family [Cladophialophora carrionii]
MEERDPKGSKVAQSLITLFSGKFRDMQYTVHPAGLPGEAPGKSSNVSWAAKQIERKYLNNPNWSSVLVTVMDSDTHLLSQYFETVVAHHLRHRKYRGMTDMSLYMPPIVFDRNAHLVPQLVRVADLMWAGAGLSCFTSKPTPTTIAIPTAVYTVPLPLICLAGGWDTGSEAIGEDMHMMLKCYFATNGRLTIRPIASPASQCNVATGKPGIRGWLADHSARYAQGLRHMWGCLDTGYAVRRWCKISLDPKAQEHATPGSESSSSSSVGCDPERPRHVEICLQLSQHALHGPKLRRFTWRNLILFSRLFEAHFLPIHLFLVLLASAIYTALPYPLTSCASLTVAMDLTSYLRAASFFLMTIYFVIFYEAYHQACIEARANEMKKAGLYEELADEFSHRKRLSFVAIMDYLLFPVAGTLFGSVPLLQAIVSHFWTEKLVYLVSAKPLKAIAAGVLDTRANESDAMLRDV